MKKIENAMKRIKNISIALSCFCLTTIGLASCNIGGLELQQSYDYIPSPVNLKMDMTAYQFIESRKSIDMSTLYEAINRIGYRDSFEVQNRTYIVLNDVAFNNCLASKGYSALKYMSNADIQKFLNQYIIIGLYTSLNLTAVPKKVQTIDPSVQLSLYLYPVTSDVSDKYQIYFNKWGTTGYQRLIVTSNLQPTNGIIHVTDSYL